MNNLYNKELLEDVAIQLKFESPTYVEKDGYITLAIHALAKITDNDFDLIFAGGTCLAKAHRIISRMSEDIDFKIVQKNVSSALTKSALRNKLSDFRQKICKTLTDVGFSIETNRIRSRDNNSYTNITLDYPSYFDSSSSLKPYIMLEFTLAELRANTLILPVQSFVDDVLKNNEPAKNNNIKCVSLVETAAEKWVGLTRRIAAIARGHDPLDETLVRHIYDLQALSFTVNSTDKFPQLIKQTIEQDRNKFKRHQEYFISPSDEINYSLKILSSDPNWHRYYNEFVNTMVYDEKTLDYKKCCDNLKKIADSFL